MSLDYKIRVLQIYAEYPRKLGKGLGLNRVRSQCKNEKDLDLLMQAVHNYKAHLVREGTEKQYIMYFSTFMSHWKDWLDPETGRVDIDDMDLTGMGFE